MTYTRYKSFPTKIEIAFSLSLGYYIKLNFEPCQCLAYSLVKPTLSNFELKLKLFVMTSVIYMDFFLLNHCSYKYSETQAHFTKFCVTWLNLPLFLHKIRVQSDYKLKFCSSLVDEVAVFVPAAEEEQGGTHGLALLLLPSSLLYNVSK